MSHGSLRYFDTINKQTQLRSLMASSYHARNFGDCWAYALVAEGKLDVVLEAEISIWDIAATVTIVQEAGGRTSDLEGNPITLTTNSFVATNGILHDEVIGKMG